MSVVSTWFTQCSQGNTNSCRKLYEILYLGPRLARELRKIFGPVIIVPIPKPWPPPRPGPDPAPDLPASFAREAQIARAAYGDPDPQPNIISRADQIKSLTRLKGALQGTIASLDKEIEKLKSQS